MTFPFSQVDVFSLVPFGGNPVAVVHDADGVDDETMAAFARWTNLSETTFLLTPTTTEADYRLRIWTPGGELPFAGHPTLGTAHAWLDAGGTPRGEDVIQECAAGLIRIRRRAGRLAFAAPPLVRSGPVDEATLTQIATALGIERPGILAHQWTDNGPGWVSVLLANGAVVRELRPDFAAMGDLKIGVVGPQEGETAFEVRAFCPGFGVAEDPVTGSLNAGLAQWLRSAGRAPASYVAAQGTALGRTGRIFVDDDGSDIWIGGDCRIRVTGSLNL